MPERIDVASRTFETDERADPRIVEVLKMVGGFAPPLEEPALDAGLEACLAYCTAFETASAEAHPLMFDAMPKVASVEISQTIIKGADNNDITLHIHKPKQSNAEELPCIVHLHGGGMVLMTAADPGYIRWRTSLAETGLIVIGVEFRNGGGSLGNHPFPAGLNDCASAVQWAHKNKQVLGISSIVISGESGGGNLSLATTLKAKKESWIDQIDGVYAMCPYISGTYAEPPKELPSLIENDGYLLNGPMMHTLTKVYDPSGAHSQNPLAWPYHVSQADLHGLPPHFVSVNELDPLRDEGLVYYRKLLAAKVTATARTVHGTPHAGDMGFPDITPDIYQTSIDSISSFAKSL